MAASTSVATGGHGWLASWGIVATRSASSSVPAAVLSRQARWTGRDRKAKVPCPVRPRVPQRAGAECLELAAAGDDQHFLAGLLELGGEGHADGPGADDDVPGH